MLSDGQPDSLLGDDGRACGIASGAKAAESRLTPWSPNSTGNQERRQNPFSSVEPSSSSNHERRRRIGDGNPSCHGVSEPSRGARGRRGSETTRFGRNHFLLFSPRNWMQATVPGSGNACLESLSPIPGAAKQAGQENSFNSAHFHRSKQTRQFQPWG